MANRTKEGKDTVGAIVEVESGLAFTISQWAKKKQIKEKKSFTYNDGLLACISEGAKKLCK